MSKYRHISDESIRIVLETLNEYYVYANHASYNHSISSIEEQSNGNHRITFLSNPMNSDYPLSYVSLFIFVVELNKFEHRFDNSELEINDFYEKKLRTLKLEML